MQTLYGEPFLIFNKLCIPGFRPTALDPKKFSKTIDLNNTQ